MPHVSESIIDITMAVSDFYLVIYCEYFSVSTREMTPLSLPQLNRDKHVSAVATDDSERAPELAVRSLWWVDPGDAPSRRTIQRE